VKPPIRRTVVRRVASPGAAALRARAAAAEAAAPRNRIQAGALEDIDKETRFHAIARKKRELLQQRATAGELASQRLDET